MEIALTSSLNDCHLPYLEYVEYRCALVAEAVYRNESLPQYGLPLATEEQIPRLTGKFRLCDLTDDVREAFYYDQRSDSFMLAFSGTDPMNPNDLINNISQFAGLTADYYQQGVQLVQSIAESDRGKILLTGHSLGGGVATVAAVAGRMNAVVFNPPALHQNTLNKFDGLNLALAESNVRRFVVAGEILDIVNHIPSFRHTFIGEKTQLYGSFNIPLSSIFSLSASLKKFIPGVGLALGVLSPILEKSVRLHLMDEVLYGLRGFLGKRSENFL